MLSFQDMAEFQSLLKKGDKSGKGRLLKAKFSVTYISAASFICCEGSYYFYM